MIKEQQFQAREAVGWERVTPILHSIDLARGGTLMLHNTMGEWRVMHSVLGYITAFPEGQPLSEMKQEALDELFTRFKGAADDTLKSLLSCARPMNLSDLNQALVERGCVPDDQGYTLCLETPCGMLRISTENPRTYPNEIWVMSKFDEPSRAYDAHLLGLPSVTGGVNPFSGKWNFTKGEAFLAALDELLGRKDKR